MRAVVYSEPGPSSVLHLVEREAPTPGPGEIRVRVIRSGVNPTDWKARAGNGAAFDEIAPNQDGAGVVDALGDGVDGFVVGDRVWLLLAQHGRPIGTAAQFTVQPADRVIHLPDQASFDLGASLGVPAITAHRALTASEHGPERLGPGTLDGTVVLVAGGAGAVGNAAIQLAHWSGATVITTISGEEKGRLATAAGADHIVNYRTGNAAEAIRTIAPDGVDIVVEVAPAVNNALDMAVMANHGTIAIYANNGGDQLTIDVQATFFRNLRYQFLLLYTLAPDLLRAAAEDVNAAVSAGALRVGDGAGVPLHHFALADAAAAHDAVENGAVGKVLIDVA
jgi:NADPH2:quinone reductase